MLQPIIIMLKRISRVVRGIDIDALHFPCELFFKCLESKEVVAMDEHVVKDVTGAVPDIGMIGKRWDFDEDAGFESRTLLLANPRQFQFLHLCHDSNSLD